MPKREPTPPPPDGEPLYLTILNPYPPNASMALVGDVGKLALWLMAVTGNPNVLLAIFHKPSSPRLIILELDRSFQDMRRLLGQHFWGGPKGFLDRFSPADQDNYSAIYYCHYTTARNVEKHGWKRLWFEGRHFEEQTGEDRISFKHPYPATTYLPVPSTEPTALDLCRHLPLDKFPEVGSNRNKPSEAPVGSKTWAVKKDLPPSVGGHKKPPVNKSGPAISVSGATAALSTPDVADEPQDPQEPQDLWAGSSQPENKAISLMSDLANASRQGESELDQEICPYHGITCKKLCEWRTDRDRRRGPKLEGPSNIKNYHRPSRGGKNDRARPRDNTTRASEHPANPSSPDSANISFVTASPTTAGKGSSTVKRAPPPPPGLGWSGVVSPVKQTASETVPSVVPARGVVIGAARGAPAWSSRGRGRGRAV